MVITSGTVQALDLLARATLSAGDLVGIEEPGYPLAPQVFQARQARLVPIAVDHDGLQVQTLPHGPSAPLLVYVTPSHQYPLASRLSIARRLALLEWARTHDSLIVEDDYDSEFRFDAPPLPALVAALQIPDVQISAPRGLLVIRRGKGLKHREIPLVQEAREPLNVYFKQREHLAEHWRERATVRGETVASWSRWPDGHLFLGQRGPLAERGVREIIAKLGQAAINR